MKQDQITESQLIDGLGDIAQQIGQDRYESVSKDQAAIIAFGMTPIELVDDFRPKFKALVARCFAEKLRDISHPDDSEKLARTLARCVKPTFTAEMERAPSGGSIPVQSSPP